MGTRTNLLVEHDLPDPFDRAAVLDRLEPSLSEAMAVHDFWKTYDPDDAKCEEFCWEASPPFPAPHDILVYYDAPGGLFVNFTFASPVVNVRASLRWRGFLSIEPLRRVHLSAFRKLAALLGAKRIVYMPDDDPIIYDARLEGATLDDCIAELRRRWGPPQKTVELINPAVVREADHRVPSVWFLETISAKHDSY